VTGGPGAVPFLFGASAGLLALLAAREVAGSGAALSAWVRLAIEPLRLARREGYEPTSRERRRIAALAGGAAIVGGWVFAGAGVALLLSALAPAAAGLLLSREHRRHRRAFERGVPGTALAIADSLSAGHSPAGALSAVAGSLEEPARSEFVRLRRALELGVPSTEALRSLARRHGSERVDAFVAALVSQRTAGGDLAGLLRRFAEGAAERDRVADDARSATAQARFTGYLVAAMPAGAALFAELLMPGFAGTIFRSPPALAIVGFSMAMQAFGFAVISRLATVGLR
jgi:tight adherence protein B